GGGGAPPGRPAGDRGSARGPRPVEAGDPGGGGPVVRDATDLARGVPVRDGGRTPLQGVLRRRIPDRVYRDAPVRTLALPGPCDRLGANGISRIVLTAFARSTAAWC